MPSSIVANLALRCNHNSAARAVRKKPSGCRRGTARSDCAHISIALWAGAVLVILCFFRTTANRVLGASSGPPLRPECIKGSV
jgi:hypothetical protein